MANCATSDAMPALHASPLLSGIDSPDESTQFQSDIGADSDDDVETMQLCDAATERPRNQRWDMDVQRSESSAARGNINSTDSPSMRRNMTTLNLLVDGDSEDDEDMAESMDPRHFMMDTFRRSGSLQVPSHLRGSFTGASFAFRPCHLLSRIGRSAPGRACLFVAREP